MALQNFLTFLQLKKMAQQFMMEHVADGKQPC
jgi:hypothetical protein